MLPFLSLMKVYMSQNNEVPEAIKELNKLSLAELVATKRSIRVLNKIFHTAGILNILMIFVWPGIFTLLFGAALIYMCVQLSLGADLVLTALNKNIERLKKNG